MSIIKPYTFQGGTKARANEVNENFDRLYEQVNANITDIANMETEITNLGLDKADVAGSSLQRFAVADAVGDYDAVNLQTLRYLIWNSRGVIRGYVISKDSNNRIRVAWGVCYDSNETVVLPLRSSLAKTNNGQIANATYYVYSIGNDNGTTIDILITPSSSNPNLPEGYTKYRGIGYFKTNNSNQISEVHSYSADAPSGVANVVGFYHSGDSGYMAFSNGFIINWGVTRFDGGEVGTNAYFIKPFATASYGLTLTWTARQNAGDKQMNYCIGSRGTNYFNFVTETERFNSQAGYMYWIAVGF